MTNLIEQLAELVGFHQSYTDAFGNQVYANDEARRALLKAMGYNIDDEGALNHSITELREQSWRKVLPNVHIAHSEQAEHLVIISIKSDIADSFNWVIETEAGETIKGQQTVNEMAHVEYAKFDHDAGIEQYNKFSFALPKLTDGYHKITITHGDITDSCHLIFAPKTCYSPQEAADFKMWGYAAQLYSLTSENNWGLGNFGDLSELMKISAAQGASAIGLNPLHPLYQNNPAHCSPYSPTSRCFLNTMYIDVTKVDNYLSCTAAQKIVKSKEFKDKLAAAKASELIDYVAVAGLKYHVLDTLFKDFIKNGNEDFEAYKAAQGDALLRHATFEALYEYFREQDFHAFGWSKWPAQYQEPNSAEVKAFQQSHRERIDYFAYLQWLAHSQLMAAKNTAKENGMPVGLYLDLAVGCDGSGVDVWSDKGVYVAGASVGAPPDLLNTLGQDWGLTPMNPVALQVQGYQPLVRALRSNMQYAGALRIDHILGLMRQYWVAPGMKADQGIFITYPLDDILRIIALESRRSECVVIGEDLGTVPDGFSEVMQAAGLLSYKVLYFETWESGLFMRPETYPELSMVTVSTHDLPTLTGWWTGRDLEWRQNLNLYPNEAMGSSDREGRISDRANLLAALEDMQVMDMSNAPQQAPAEMNRELTLAVQKFLAHAPSRIQLIPMEDALEIREQVNIPGTIDEHPNWRQKLPVTIEAFAKTESVVELSQALQHVRPKK
ncbi:4-alpha-glucanotransferase [Thalassotalea sp. M1531]|uniref:4-alpha-glucanotransferase n=1 Tax=Thalassotalea algicola TaxID=2716224 RepID=A0A7Y0L9A2_9GAMM|nr:4-alpha-glucanotransferase [Thalassotalea algicola]NMP29999.1 4-alpha-glucanotransferase [Thalassotalea algicola]